MRRSKRPDDYTRWDPFEVRYWGRVDKGGPIPSYAPHLGPCWLWTGKLGPKGYGFKIQDRGVKGYPHQFAYRMEHGPIPDGMVIDHLCRVRQCVNPGHLEPVPATENTHRGADARRGEPCPNGHPYSMKRVLPSGNTVCVPCRRARDRERDARDRDKRRAQARERYARKNNTITQETAA